MRVRGRTIQRGATITLRPVDRAAHPKIRYDTKADAEGRWTVAGIDLNHAPLELAVNGLTEGEIRSFERETGDAMT